MSPAMENWAQKISRLQALGWSLTRLGRAIGLSPQALSDIKQGRTKAPAGMAAVRLHEIHERGERPPSTAKPEAA